MQKKLKLLHIVEAMGGGVFTYMVDLSNELIKDYDIYIAFSVRPQTPQDYYKYFDKRIHLIKVKNFVREINFYKDLKAFLEIKEIVKKIEPNFIHLHSSKAGALGRWAWGTKDIPLYYTPHGYSFLMDSKSQIKRKFYKFIEVFLSRKKCITISCSKGEHEETLKFNKHAVYVNNGINLKELQKSIRLTCNRKEEHNEIKGITTIFTSGRICYQKNPALFNEIALMMPKTRFLWIGDGELRGKLTAPNIEITGWVTRDEAVKYSVKSDIFILPSLWEGLPISLLEAMYMKKPCIVNNVIGNRDVIKNDVNGFVCNNSRQYVCAINKCMERDNNIIQKYVERAYMDILEKYNTTIMARKYSEIYLGGGESRY